MHTLINGTNMPAVKRREHQQANCRVRRQASHRNIARSYRDAYPSSANIEPGTRSMRLIKLRKPTCLTLRVALYAAHRTYTRERRIDLETKGSTTTRIARQTNPFPRSLNVVAFTDTLCLVKFVNVLTDYDVDAAVWIFQFGRAQVCKSSAPNISAKKSIRLRKKDTNILYIVRLSSFINLDAHETFVYKVIYLQIYDFIR